MKTLYLILYFLAALSFLVAAFRASMRGVDRPGGPDVVRTVDLVALGLLFWVLVPLIQQIDSM